MAMGAERENCRTQQMRLEGGGLKRLENGIEKEAGDKVGDGVGDGHGHGHGAANGDEDEDGEEDRMPTITLGLIIGMRQ